VLVETLAGSRPPRQMTTWTTERTRARIQRLGPMLAAGQRPQLRRVVAFRPASGVIEMTVVVSFGSRVRALAVRLEHTPPPRALPGHQPRRPRWLCTDVEAALEGIGTGGAVAGPHTAVRASRSALGAVAGVAVTALVLAA
jgi:hypothetical protein